MQAGRFTALLDANVLYPAPMRDLLIEIARTDLFKARWSADIHREWIEALLRHEPRRDRAVLERTRDLMNAAVRDCLVAGYEPLIAAVTLPDADDRHVLAAAIAGACDVIVTQNLRHFPATALAAHNIEAQHPDEFLLSHLNLAPDVFCQAVRKLRVRLKHPPYGVDDYLDTLRRQGLVATAAQLQQFTVLL
jgi:predicted nucleic acid-binding protein